MKKPGEQLETLRDELEQLRRWLFDHSLPLWAGAGIHSSGVCFEALDFDGQAIQSDAVRVRVIARQLFVFSLAHRLGWQQGRCVTLIESLFTVLDDICRNTDGLYGKGYSLQQRALTDDTYCLYDTAFALLGFASARNVLGGARADAAAARTLDALERCRPHADGGFVEDDPPSPEPLPDRLQNPHMHLFESLLALRDAGFDDRIDERLQTLAAFINRQFFDRDLGIVHERRPGEPTADTHFEPGHSLEWVWLLVWQARASGTDVDGLVTDLYLRALSSIGDSVFASMEATVGGELADASRRLWSQAEALKAHLSIAAISRGERRQQAIDAAAKLSRGLRKDWLAPAVDGGWHDHVDSTGALIASTMPASTGYHLFGAIEFAWDRLQYLSADTPS